jgi:TolB protein
VTRLTHTAWNEWDPDWARVDDRIVFVSNQTSLNGEIFSMAADGSDVRRLTTNVNGDTQPSWGATWDRIAFYGSRPQGQALYTMREDGGDVALLVPQSLRPSSPAWAPVGDAILFSGYRPGSGYSEILRVQADGSGLVLLTENEVNFDWAPGWLGAW